MTELLLKIFVKNYKSTKSKKVRESYGTFGGIVGICCNVILCVIKILIGSLTSSISIVADGLNNLSDMGSSVITMIGFKLAGKPADRDHPFGHGRMEYMSAFVVSCLILIVGFELFTSSLKALIYKTAAPVYSVWAIIALIVSIVIKLWMYIFNKKLGKAIDSSAFFATASDCINDCISTAAILVAAVISMLFTLPFNLDAVMALGVAVFILRSGYISAKETIDEILGGPPSKELIKELENSITAFDMFHGIHDLIVHNYGPGRQFASVHVEVPQNVDIIECHEQIDICEKIVSEKTGVELVIHMDPIDVNNESVMKTRETIAQAIKAINPELTLHDFRMTPNAKQKTNLIFDVVVPAKLGLTNEELDKKINELAKSIDETYCCVITFDNDYTGK